MRKVRGGVLAVAQADAPALTAGKAGRAWRGFFQRFGNWIWLSPICWPIRIFTRSMDSLRHGLSNLGLSFGTAGVIVGLIALATLSVLAAGTYYGGTKVVRIIRVNRFLAQARLEYSKGEFAKAGKLLALLLQTDQNNLAAHTLLADMLTKARSPQALIHRKRITEIAPEDASKKIELADAAIMFAQFPLAGQALDGIPEGKRQTPEYLRLRAACEMASGRPAVAEENLRSLLRLKPDDSATLLRLGVLELQRTKDPAAAAATRAKIAELLDRPEVALDTARALTMSYTAAGERDNALRTARVAAAHPQARIADQLALLNTLLVAAPTQTEPVLADLKERLAGNSAEIFEICRWMLGTGRYAEADAWLMSLPPAVRDVPQLLVIRGDACVAMKQWERLEAVTLTNDAWGEVEYMRLAFSARAAREMGQPAISRTRWVNAVRAAGENLPQLHQLQQIANAWSWTDERTDVDWVLVNAEPKSATNLLRSLYAYYRDKLDSVGLRRVFEKLVELHPEDRVARRNLAMLYLASRSLLPRAHELAARAYLEKPDDLEAFVAYAFSVYLRGETGEAIALMEARMEAVKSSPYACGYYGLMLAGTSRRGEARPFLDEGLKSKLLPEESNAIRVELARL